MDIKPVKVDATVMWAFLRKRNEMSGKYQVDLCNLTDGDAAALEQLGVVVKENVNKPEKGKYITCKSANYEIDAYDTHGNPIKEEVGNGSKARALIGVYEWKFKGKKGVSPSLKKLVITDLNEDKPGKVEDDDEL